MIQMKTLQLTNDLFYCGVQDPGLRTFDIIMHTEFGTSYNSYLLRAGDKTVLFETSKEKFEGQYLSTLKTIVDPATIDTLVVSHTEPDHVGSLAGLLALNPNLRVVGTVGAIGFLKQILNRDFNGVVVKDGETMTIGNKTLRFMGVPNLHWPDTMYTYIEEEKALVTCDSFGAHYACEGILRSAVTDEAGYLRAAKYYFDNIIGPFKQPFMATALSRIKDLDMRLICTGHGPVLDSHIEEILALYRAWVSPAPLFDAPTVVIAYVSAYGYTRRLAQLMAEGVQAAGAQAKLYDLETADTAEVAAAVTASCGFLLGSPTILGDALAPVAGLTLHLLSPLVKGKPAAAFGSYGWSGEAVPNLTERLKQLKCKVQEGYRIRFRASEQEEAQARAFGESFAKTALGKE